MASDPITLAVLADAVGGALAGYGGVTVTDVTHDSREAGPGVLFVAIRGFRVDGHAYLDAAVAAGSPAVCVEDPAAVPGVPAIVVPDTRAALGPLAARVHGDPSAHMDVVGVTGTNGKTTVAHLLESIVAADGGVPGLVGTVGARIGGEPIPVARTTPEASDFQRLLASMAGAGVRVAAVEVSSHALALGRVDATRFAVAAFTNLSQDHLDFHDDMEDYYLAKASLFVPSRASAAVVWVDDPAGNRLAAETTLPVTRVGVGADADVTARDVVSDLTGSAFVASGPGGEARVRLRIPGGFNVANALVAAACAAEVGIGWDSIAAGIGAVDRVAGRFELVDAGEDCTIVVDYAHTPEGIASVIGATRSLAPGARVLAVVGAGGDRDRAKRPLMGAAAARADVAFFTSDNPRSEDPAAILTAVAAGAEGGPAEVVTEVDRRAAIGRAIRAAGPGDVVLILGKGHEQGQEIGGEVLPFDDVTVAREEAARR
ncbi:MAG: UDP-N-acetylmuramoyl-L-alanyl-D-glutamate--2,6-diaminopimelate ligase [Actinobacteria bacterium]|nr:UDP-N-acetylmuramoyl-L-alanyl-D-glutamate--2,6-diaminopimelate ligase [Actinomycetota bacterium]